MPTKAELQGEIDDLRNLLRRTERALGQAQLDLSDIPSKPIDRVTPALTPKVREVLARGEAEWSRVVVDPCERVNAYIQSREGLGWSWEKPYERNGQFAWCGAFASFCFTAVRFPIRQKIFPSCYRLYKNWSNTSRHIPIENMMAGDIVVVFSSKRSVQGDHITIATSSIENGEFNTIEGNAHGTLGDGSYGEGVVKNTRKVEQVAHVYRLLEDDFDE